MSKRTRPKVILALLMLFAGAQAAAQSVSPTAAKDSTVVVAGVVSFYDDRLGIAAVGDVTVFVGDLAAAMDVTIFPGDELLLIGTSTDATGFVRAITMEFVSRPTPQSIEETSKKSITGTGRQSITGTGKQSITGTGKQSITGTGSSLQSITGTGIAAQSITGTGKSSITGTGSR